MQYFCLYVQKFNEKNEASAVTMWDLGTYNITMYSMWAVAMYNGVHVDKSAG